MATNLLPGSFTMSEKTTGLTLGRNVVDILTITNIINNIFLFFRMGLPSGALERPFGPICTLLVLFCLGRQMGVPLIFFRSVDRVYDFTLHIKKSKKIGPSITSYAHLKVRLNTLGTISWPIGSVFLPPYILLKGQFQIARKMLVVGQFAFRCHLCGHMVMRLLFRVM